MSEKLSKQERQHRIVAAIAANAAVGISALAENLNVTKQTIRRDLDELSAEGLINRTYGGGSIRPVGLEPSFVERSNMSASEREAIARLAAGLLSDDEVIMLGAGVTTHYLARELALRSKRQQVLTNNINAVAVLAVNPNIRTIIAPGNYEIKEGCVVGEETLAFLDKFHADTAVIGASGVHKGGVCEVHSGIAWVDRTMLKRARRHILLVLSAKLDMPNLELVCPLDQIDILVTDRLPGRELLEALHAAKVKIVTPEGNTAIEGEAQNG